MVKCEVGAWWIWTQFLRGWKALEWATANMNMSVLVHRGTDKWLTFPWGQRSRKDSQRHWVLTQAVGKEIEAQGFRSCHRGGSVREWREMGSKRQHQRQIWSFSESTHGCWPFSFYLNIFPRCLSVLFHIFPWPKRLSWNILPSTTRRGGLIVSDANIISLVNTLSILYFTRSSASLGIRVVLIVPGKYKTSISWQYAEYTRRDLESSVPRGERALGRSALKALSSSLYSPRVGMVELLTSQVLAAHSRRPSLLAAKSSCFTQASQLSLSPNTCSVYESSVPGAMED